MKKIYLFFLCCILGLSLLIPGNIQAQTLKHSYTFEEGTLTSDRDSVLDVVGDAHGTILGTKISVASGMCTVSGATTSTDGYVSFDGAKLALNTYGAITLEFYVKTTAAANGNVMAMLAYFGNNTGGKKCFWVQPVRKDATESRIEISDGTTNTRTAKFGKEFDEGAYHHVVAILTSQNLKYYVDGDLLCSISTNGANYISTLDNVTAYLFKGAWSDPNYNGSIDKFNIYDGELDNNTIKTSAVSYIGNNKLASLTSDIGTFLPKFASDTTVYQLFVPTGTTTVNLSATAKDAAATVTITNNGVIDISAGTTTASIVVTSTPGGVAKSYSVVIGVGESNCFTPLFTNKTNIILDPQMTSLSTFGGWGGKSIATGATSYCGLSSGLISGGSIDFVLTSIIKPNTTYRVRAMVNAATTAAQIGVYGWNLGSGDITTKATVTAAWAPIDFSFTTGANLGNGIGLFFNNSTGSYIDNWEMYEVSNDSTLSALTVDAGSLSPAFDPAVGNYSVVLPNTATSVNVSATANNAGAVVTGTGAITLTSGSGTATIVVTAESGKTKTYTINFITQATIVTNVKGLIIEDLSPKDSITVTGANLLSDITITTPVGITVNPTTISKESTSAVKVYVTYDGTTLINDSIVFTSGTLVKKVGIKTYSNAGCFTPLYSTGNLIPDPYMNSLSKFSASWGSRNSIVTGAEAYCGKSSAKINGVAVCYPDGGSITTPNTTWVKRAKYRFRAMVKTMDGSFNIGAGNILGETTPAPKNIVFAHTNGEWKQFDSTFVAGAAATAGQIYFNNCEGSSGKVGYIDNWEMYQIPSINVPSSITYLGTGTKKVPVYGFLLTDSIIITAPASFSVNPDSVAKNIAGDSVAITFNGPSSASGYVVFASGSVKDSIFVKGTIDPTIVPSLSVIAFDELNLKDSVTINGANLTSDITIVAPAGISVTPTTIPMGSATNVKVFATWDGTTIPAAGDITFTSGSLVVKVAAKGSPNSSCFTPLFSSGNIIPDPYMNSLTPYFGWGTKIVCVRPDSVYCGTRSGKIGPVGAGSIDIHFTTLESNATYRMKAAVMTIGGKFRFGMDNLGSNVVAKFDTTFDTNGKWQIIDMTINTGAGATCTSGWFNNYSLSGVTGYIDNWEFYKDPGTNVNDIKSDEVTVSPNPANEYIVIRGISTSAKLVIFNLQGKSLKTVDNVTAGNEINISDLAQGYYLVKIITKSGTTVKRILVK